MTAGSPPAHMSGMEALYTNQTNHKGDANSRLAAAHAPESDTRILWQLIDDSNDLVANTARARLNLILRPVPVAHVVNIPVIDPTAGRIIP